MIPKYKVGDDATVFEIKSIEEAAKHHESEVNLDWHKKGHNVYDANEATKLIQVNCDGSIKERPKRDTITPSVFDRQGL